MRCNTLGRLALDAPTYAEQDGYFVVTFYGPNGNYERLKTPAGAVGLIPPAVEAQLNERQKKIMVQVQKNGSVTSGWCRENLKCHLRYGKSGPAGRRQIESVETRRQRKVIEIRSAFLIGYR